MYRRDFSRLRPIFKVTTAIRRAEDSRKPVATLADSHRQPDQMVNFNLYARKNSVLGVINLRRTTPFFLDEKKLAVTLLDKSVTRRHAQRALEKLNKLY